ncbi:MAG: carbohydrate kinase [Gammaproteobacteria bacterium]|nr:carbohydrate kinase [Gammaproteobacteria bacterium]
MKNSNRPCIFGEVLFDHFPDGSRVLGGAPFNVAWHLQAFGLAPRFISRVGNDAEGRQIRAAMESFGMETDALQTDPNLPTGLVSVKLQDNEPSYDIVHPAAYDAIDTCNAYDGCELLYHGSLALRDTTSRQALRELIDAKARLVFIDVNLRPPWWQREQILDLLKSADWLKVNGDELRALYPACQSVDEGVTHLIGEYDLQGIVVTHGASGASLYSREGKTETVKPGQNNTVVDTVGAGDAFTSVLILGLLRQWPSALTLQRAQAFASRIVANRGALMTDISSYQPFVDDWKLAN